MLPGDTPYIDAFPGMSMEEAIEEVVVFEDVYPRRIGTMSDIVLHESFFFDRIEKKRHQCSDFIRRTIPVLGGERI